MQSLSRKPEWKSLPCHPFWHVNIRAEMAAAKGRENFHGTLWNTMQCRYTCSYPRWNDVSKRPSTSFRLSWKRHWRRNFTRSYRVIFDVGRIEQFLEFQNTLKGGYFLLPREEIFPPFAAGFLRISLCSLILVRPSRPYRTRSTLQYDNVRSLRDNSDIRARKKVPQLSNSKYTRQRFDRRFWLLRSLRCRRSF